MHTRSPATSRVSAHYAAGIRFLRIQYLPRGRPPLRRATYVEIKSSGPDRCEVNTPHTDKGYLSTSSCAGMCETKFPGWYENEAEGWARRSHSKVSTRWECARKIGLRRIPEVRVTIPRNWTHDLISLQSPPRVHLIIKHCILRTVVQHISGTTNGFDSMTTQL